MVFLMKLLNLKKDHVFSFILGAALGAVIGACFFGAYFIAIGGCAVSCSVLVAQNQKYYDEFKPIGFIAGLLIAAGITTAALSTGDVSQIDEKRTAENVQELQAVSIVQNNLISADPLRELFGKSIFPSFETSPIHPIIVANQTLDIQIAPNRFPRYSAT